ncbi:MAG: single-stranded DNA-binding protein [Candidatus Eisenbacteria bacterium]
MAEVRLGTLNKVLLIGRLTRDPETRYTAGGAAVVNMGLAVNRRFQDQGGEWRDETCFVNVVAWRKLAERLSNQAKKGSALFVEGRLQSRSWEAQDGSRRSTIEVNALSVQVLDKRDSGTSDSGSGENADTDMPPGEDDDIPF